MEYKLDGKYLTVKIPKSALGLTGNDYTVNFAWTDNVHDADDAAPADDTAYRYTKFSGDIMDFYLSGDAAPGGRFKFSYVSTAENAGVTPETEVPTEAPTHPAETPTEAPDGQITEAPTDGETEASKGGCGSVVGMGSAAVAVAAAVAMKKKERKW